MDGLRSQFMSLRGRGWAARGGPPRASASPTGSGRPWGAPFLVYRTGEIRDV
jgi:hypothetical protein